MPLVTSTLFRAAALTALTSLFAGSASGDR